MGKSYQKTRGVVKQNPRLSNTGVENTLPSPEKWQNSCKIDWLACTLWQIPLLDTEVDARNRPSSRSGLVALLDRWHKAEDLGALPDAKRYVDLASSLDSLSEERAEEDKAALASRWSVDMVPELLGLPDLVPQKMPKGANGYRTCHMVGSARVYSDGSPGMGIHVVLSGEAVDDLPISPLLFIRRVLATGGRFSRVDLAIDEFSGRLDLPAMVSDAKAARVRSRLAEGGVYESFALATGEHTGLTFYLGNRESETFFRFYDKRLEALKKGALADELPPYWVRAEAELKSGAAQTAAVLLVSSSAVDENGSPLPQNIPVAELAPGIFSQYMTFCAPSKDTNRSRWKPAKWWLDFIETDRRFAVSTSRPKTDMDRRRRWFAKQCAPAMAGIAEAFGVDALQEIFVDGRNRQSESLKQDIADTKAKLAATSSVSPSPAPISSSSSSVSSPSKSESYSMYRMRSKIESLEAQLHEAKKLLR